MVKNTSGGTKTKGLARKHVRSAGGGGAALRLPQEELEVIVAVGAMLGNGMCEVFNNDGERFIAHIRAKFKGRHKRANLIAKNSIILCGYREWEKPYKNLDVIFIYDDYNINQLRENPTINKNILNVIKRISLNNNLPNTEPDDLIENDLLFTNDILHTPTPTPTPTNTNTYTYTNTNTNTNIDIDITDI
jgi:hypothetical protein